MSERVGPDTGFKLRPLIQEVLGASEATEPDELALEVLERIAEYDRETALFQALKALVRESWRPASTHGTQPADPFAERVTEEARRIRTQWRAGTSQAQRDVAILLDEIERLSVVMEARDDLLYRAWVVIANVSEGRWEAQTQEWQDAAAGWRDAWHAIPTTPDPIESVIVPTDQ